MNVVSFNARGLGGGEKRAEVRRLVKDKNPLVMCIQESKWTMVSDIMIKSIWGDGPCGYSYQSSVGASGGLVTVWDSSMIDVWSTMSFGHVLIIKGKVILMGEEVTIFNVYASCDVGAKRELWEKLVPMVLSFSDTCLSMCGDFNSVRNIEERKGRGLVFRQVDTDNFNNFIAKSSLIDLPICGRLFTWYRGDGVSMSKLDRFLLSEKWCAAWPNSIQVACQRFLSDHVPLVLYMDDANWGPRPIRMLKCWSSFRGMMILFVINGTLLISPVGADMC